MNGHAIALVKVALHLLLRFPGPFDWCTHRRALQTRPVSWTEPLLHDLTLLKWNIYYRHKCRGIQG